MDSRIFNVCDYGEDFGQEDGDAPEVLPVDAYLDGLVSSYFEKDGDEIVVDLPTVFVALSENENELNHPPEHFNIVETLEKQRIPEERTQHEKTALLLFKAGLKLF